jgi:hypothetical protein
MEHEVRSKINQIKKLKKEVLKRMSEKTNKQFSHPYEKHSRKKYKAPPSSIETRSMRRSQEMSLKIPISEQKDLPQPKKRRPTKKTKGKATQFSSENVSL